MLGESSLVVVVFVVVAVLTVVLVVTADAGVAATEAPPDCDRRGAREAK